MSSINGHSCLKRSEISTFVWESFISKTKVLILYNILIKQRLIISIAALVSLLVNLPRFLQLFDLFKNINANKLTPVTISDVVIRIVFLFLFSWFILQFNTNWKDFVNIADRRIKNGIIVIINAVIFIVAINIFVVVYDLILTNSMTLADKRLLHFVYVIITLILMFVANILRFQKIRELDLVEKELLKQQNLQTELSALKNQINPHFLFNSLNSLNSLIRGNQQATTFVNKLSFMYRYILQSGDQNLVTLKEELKFLNSYLFLIKTRYRDKFNAHVLVDEKWMNCTVPVLSLQLLVENAVKHNEISESYPLEVRLYVEGNSLIVENPIRPRSTFVESTGKGLANIDKRYEMLKQQKISITKNNNIFKVKLPLN